MGIVDTSKMTLEVALVIGGISATALTVVRHGAWLEEVLMTEFREMMVSRKESMTRRLMQKFRQLTCRKTHKY